MAPTPPPWEHPDSVGIVSPKIWTDSSPITLQCGETLPELKLVYETYGELNENRSNALLICHALSGNHHAAGFHEGESRSGWWDNCIGPGKPIDTNRFFVISLNNLGGCNGSTGPQSINPDTNEPYGSSFPTVSVKDWVKTQSMLADSLEITKLAAVVGGSLGGMQALQWSIDYPDRVDHAVLIACAPKLSAQNIAFNEISRLAVGIDADKEIEGEQLQGLGLARMIGHVTYLSDDSMGQKFGREVRSGILKQGKDVHFEVASYLHYQGKKFSQSFCPHTYVLMTKALDFFDPALEFGGDLIAAFKNTIANFLVVSFSSDWRFSPERSNEIVDALISAGMNVSSAEIQSTQGHDSFLMPIPRYFDVLRKYLSSIPITQK